MPDDKTWFIVKLVSCEPGIELQNLWERYRNRHGLSGERAAGDILELVEQGYITASVKVTDKGNEYLSQS